MSEALGKVREWADVADKSIDAALDLVIAAKLAVRGIEDTDITTGLGCLLELISDHLYSADAGNTKVLNILKETGNA